METLKKVLAMVRQAHKKTVEKSGNTNYFAILLCAGTLIFGSSKIGGLNISTDSQKNSENEIIVLKVNQLNIQDDIADIKIAVESLKADQVLANEKLLLELKKITEPRGLRYAR